MKYSTLLFALIVLLFSTANRIFAQQINATHEHCVPGYLFNVYENDKLVSKKVWLWVDATKAVDGGQLVECNLVFILPQEESKAFSLEAHHYSNIDGTLSNIEINSKRISFDVILSWMVPGRTIRVACDRSKSGLRFEVKALGLWTNIDGQGTIKIEWRQVDEIKLPYCRVVVPFLEMTKDMK